MNILMFNYEYPPIGGGGGVAHEIIAEELARKHRTVVVTSGMPGLATREVRSGVEILRVPVLARRNRAAASMSSLLSYPPAAWVSAARHLRRESFDIVSAFFAVPTGPASVPVAKLFGLPHVLTVLGGDIYDPSKRSSPHRSAVLRRVVSSVMRASAEVVTESENIRDHAYRHYSYDGPIRIIPLGIRIPEVPSASRKELGIPGDRFVLITVGRLVARKAVDRLIKLLAAVGRQDAQLIVVGAGPELEPLRALAHRLDLGDNVQFTGWVEEERKWRLLRAADAYISTSLHEGFGLVFLEAMAMGLPVIAPDAGGQVDFLKDGATGFVTAAGDDEAMVRAVVALMASPDEAKRMGEANRRRARRFSAEACADQYEALFQQVVRDNSST